MKIAILGSTGFVGRVLLKKALAVGYEVKVLVRDPEKLGDLKDTVEVVQGNYFEADKVEQTIKGTEVILSTIGPLAKDTGSPAQFERAMVDLISTMKNNHIKRIIWTGGAPTAFENEKLGLKRSLLKIVIDLYWGKHVLHTKNLEYAVKNGEFRQDLYFRLKAITVEIPPLRKRIQDLPILVKKFTSDIDWTLVRPPQIIDGKPTGNVIADENNLPGLTIDVEDVAHFLLAQINSDRWIKKAPLVASK